MGCDIITETRITPLVSVATKVLNHFQLPDNRKYITVFLERRETHKLVPDHTSFLPRGPLWTKGRAVEPKQIRVGAAE